MGNCGPYLLLNVMYTSVTGVVGVGYTCPFVYDLHEGHWFSLPCWHFSLVTVSDKETTISYWRRNDIIKVTNKVFLWDEKWLTTYPDNCTI